MVDSKTDTGMDRSMNTHNFLAKRSFTLLDISVQVHETIRRAFPNSRPHFLHAGSAHPKTSYRYYPLQRRLAVQASRKTTA